MNSTPGVPPDAIARQEHAVHLEIDYLDAQHDRNRWMPRARWLLAIPHSLVPGVLTIGARLLFLVSMVCVGLLAVFILQPLVARAPFPVDDRIAIAVMSAFCFVQSGLFAYGARKAYS